MAKAPIQPMIAARMRRSGWLRRRSHHQALYATLIQVNKAILRAPSLDELLQETCRICTTSGGFDLAWIGRPDPESTRILPVAAEGPVVGYVEGLQISLAGDSPFSQGMAATAFRQGRPVVCHDWQQTPWTLPWREKARPFGIRSSAAVPVFRGGEAAAVLTLYSRQEGFFQPDRMELLESLGWDLSLAMDHFAREAERRATENSLWESELRFRTLFEAATIPIVITRHAKILEANRSFHEQFNLAPEENLRGFPILDFFAPDQRSVLGERNRLREAGQAVPNSYETQGHRRGRPPFPMAVDATLLSLPDGPVTLIFLKDISDAKQHEEIICQLNTRLERRVKDRTVQLEEANRELKAFAHSVSHDLRAPLRQISGFTDLLAGRLGPDLDPKAAHYLEVIQDATARMDQHIKDLLGFSSLGLQPMHRTRLNLNRIVQGVMDQLQVETAGRQVRWVVGELPALEGDAGLIFFLLQNLLGNAVKFTRGCPEAVIEVLPLEGRTGFLVRDNGAGFDPLQAHRLFSPFQRLHRPDEFEGTGIGLANAQRIVARHGGQIRAEGAVGRGATFVVSFPEPGKAAD